MQDPLHPASGSFICRRPTEPKTPEFFGKNAWAWRARDITCHLSYLRIVRTDARRTLSRLLASSAVPDGSAASRLDNRRRLCWLTAAGDRLPFPRSGADRCRISVAPPRQAGNLRRARGLAARYLVQGLDPPRTALSGVAACGDGRMDRRMRAFGCRRRDPYHRPAVPRQPGLSS